MPAMRWRRPPGERAAAPGPPTVPTAGTSSRTDAAAAGWGRGRAGPVLADRRRAPLAARNAVLARFLGDPTEEARRVWLRRLDDDARADGTPPPPAGPDRPPLRRARPRLGRGARRPGRRPRRAVRRRTGAAGRRGRHGPGRGVRRRRRARRRPALLRGAAPAALRRLPRPDLRRPRRRRLARRARRLHDRLLRHPARRPRPGPAEPGPAWARVVRRLLWRRGPTATVAELAGGPDLAAPTTSSGPSSPARTARSTRGRCASCSSTPGSPGGSTRRRPRGCAPSPRATGPRS